MSGAFRFKNSISFKLCLLIFCGLRVYQMNVFHTSCLLSTLFLTKKVLFSLSMEIGTLCTIFAEVLHPKQGADPRRTMCASLEPWDFSILRITHALCFSTRWRGYACNAADYACLTKHQTNSPRGECSWDLCKSCASAV